jgi:CTP synthase (UTP-ammonia lyase)
MTKYLKESACDGRQLYTVTPLKSSTSPQTQRLYAEAYANACDAVKLDTSAKYTEARDAYKSVIKVKSTYIHIQLDIDIDIDIRLYRTSQSY